MDASPSAASWESLPHGADFEDVGSDSDGEVDHDIIINSACKMEDQRPHACRALLQLRQHIASASSPPALEVEQFPALSDNYGFLVHDKVSGETAAIDTPEEAAVCDALPSRRPGGGYTIVVTTARIRFLAAQGKA